MSDSATAPAPAHVHLKYRPDIDGLRAIAVLSVVCYHAFPALMPGGFIGVDIFFVISGYLITSILLAELDRQSFSYADFYGRRIRRLFPALVTVLAATLVAGWFLLWPGEFRSLGKHTAAGAGFLANFAFWSEAGYFDVEAETKLLLHLWSLAVEEQFYFVWPLVLMLAWRSGKRIMWVLGAFALVSFVINVAGVHPARSATFFLLPARFWELAAGGLLACANLHKAHTFTRRHHLWSVVGAAFLVLGFVKLSPMKAFPGWWALAPVLGAFFLIAAGPHALLNRSLLSTPPMVWMGRISYPLYLWHWPLLAMAGIVTARVPSVTVRAACVVAAVVLADLTWRFIEKKGRRARMSARAAWGLGGAMAALLVLGLVVWQGAIAPRQNSPLIAEISRAAEDVDYFAGYQRATFNGESAMAMGSGSRTVVLLGDSHAEHYAPRAQALAASQAASGAAADTLPRQLVVRRGACPPIIGVVNPRDNECGAWQTNVFAGLLAKPPAALIISACWNCYFVELAEPRTGAIAEVNYRFVNPFDGKAHEFRGGDGAELARNSFVALVHQLAQRMPVYVVLGTPVSDALDPPLLLSRFGTGDRLPAATIPEPPAQQASNARLREQLLQVGARVIDPNATICPQGRCIRTLDDGAPIWRDRGHLRASFVRDRAGFLDEALKAAPAASAAR